MNVTYPLSLKVTVWLLLNLLLVAVAVAGFFVARGGLSWNALLAGPAGEHAQAKANIIAGEVAAATAETRAAVLTRLAGEYGADLYIARGEEISFASSPQGTLPADVRNRIEFRLPRKGFGGRGERGGTAGAPEPAGAQPGEARRVPPPPPPELALPTDAQGQEPRLVRLDATFDPGRERERIRFIIHADSPAGYWIGMRVPFMAVERGRFRGPTTVLVRVSSLWGVLNYLELQSWLFAGSALVGLSILFWLPLVRSITHSVGQLTTATEQIAEGRFDTRVDSRRRDELGKLGEAVNRMAERLDTHMTGQKRFLGDVAHELCSPLARLQMATGILADQAPGNLKETVSDVREEAQQMSSLVNELLAFTKAGMRSREVVCSPVGVESVAREVAAREDTSGRVTLSIPADLRVHAERDLLVRALGNLVRNAVRYAGASGPIGVSATQQGKHVTIAVEDEGPGVPAEALTRLGEPFFRPDEARTREGGGVGLGLAIVRQSIASCGGEVRFMNRKPKGLRAEVRLAAA